MKKPCQNHFSGFPKINESGAMVQPQRLWGGSFVRIKVQQVGKGLHPNEVVVSVTTASGKEQLVVDKRSLDARSLLIGSPVARGQSDTWLVELPRETMSGAWRVWVKKSQLIPDASKDRAA